MNSSVCEKVEKKAPEFLFGEISFLERQWMDAHLKQCDRCSRTLTEISSLLMDAGSVRFVPSLAEQNMIFQSILSEIAEADAAERSERRYRLRLCRRWVFAAAAAVSVAGLAFVFLKLTALL